jgi:hypothetical protein
MCMGMEHIVLYLEMIRLGVLEKRKLISILGTDKERK